MPPTPRALRALEDDGRQARGFDCALLNDPDGPRSSGGGPFRVFTPYYHACLRLARTTSPEPAPSRVPGPAAMPASLDPASLPGDSAHPLGSWWTPGEAGALAAAERFFGEALDDYPTDRDRPDLVGTSRLSPHLAFGEIAPQRLVTMAGEEAQEDGSRRRGRRGLRAAALLARVRVPHAPPLPAHHEPAAPARVRALRLGRGPRRASRRGRPAAPATRSWTRGCASLPRPAWMHNRVRMIVASFLTKDLLLPWQLGARHFLEHLADADWRQQRLRLAVGGRQRR